jgi:uncharacterized Fe-S cluster-containing radical SAM superfamily protein
MEKIDDYDLYDLDFEEWLRRGRVAFGLEEENELSKLEDGYRVKEIINNEYLDYDIRIHATKELIAREKIKKLIMLLVDRKRALVW